MAGLDTNSLIQNVMLFVKTKAAISQLLSDDEQLLLLFFHFKVEYEFVKRDSYNLVYKMGGS
jgi:hypothetical protein